jgi:hypothetical protein
MHIRRRGHPPRGSGTTQRSCVAALADGAASTAELAVRIYGRPSSRRQELLRRRSTRAALRSIGAVVIQENYRDGGYRWGLPS